LEWQCLSSIFFLSQLLGRGVKGICLWFVQRTQEEGKDADANADTDEVADAEADTIADEDKNEDDKIKNRNTCKA